MTDIQIMHADRASGSDRSPPNMATSFWRRALVFGTGFGIATIVPRGALRVVSFWQITFLSNGRLAESAVRA
jgi:hypothetical protein